MKAITNCAVIVMINLSHYDPNLMLFLAILVAVLIQYYGI